VFDYITLFILSDVVAPFLLLMGFMICACAAIYPDILYTYNRTMSKPAAGGYSRSSERGTGRVASGRRRDNDIFGTAATSSSSASVSSPRTSAPPPPSQVAAVPPVAAPQPSSVSSPSRPSAGGPSSGAESSGGYSPNPAAGRSNKHHVSSSFSNIIAHGPPSHATTASPNGRVGSASNRGQSSIVLGIDRPYQRSPSAVLRMY
jgi:hypothetical protein